MNIDLTVIADYQDRCGEGPLWDDRNNVLYWTDLAGARCYRYDWTEGIPSVLNEGLEIRGFALHGDAQGLLFTNSKGVWAWDIVSVPVLICDSAEGYRCDLNDCIADPVGRLLTGSVFYDPCKEYERGKLIRVDLDGSAHVLDDGFELANGLGFSPDAATLYFTDSAARRIYAYDYRAANGSAQRRRTLVAVPATEGLPDGLTVDAEGFIWSSQWFGGCVVRYDPDGRVERRIPVPAKQPSSVAFGGPDLNEIFITSAGASAASPIMPPGYDPYSGYFGGCLYRAKSDVQGRREYRARLG